MMDGDRGVLELNVDAKALREVFLDEGLVGDATEFCAPPTGPLGHEDAMETLPCSAGHTACYVSPYGDVYPCVQFPLPTGNVRKSKFLDIWKHSPEMNEVRSITLGTWGRARLARTAGAARGARGWRTWKATCAGRRARTVRSRLCGLAWRRRG